jgi:hypothetical protein
MPRELLVVVGHAVVDVDQLAGNVAVDRVGVVARELLVLLPRCRVVGQRWLLEGRREPLRLEQLQQPGTRRREEDLEFLDGRLVSPLPKQVGDELGILFAVG